MIYLLNQSVRVAAARVPRREAFVCGTERLTYGELAVKANQLGLTLMSQGVRPGDRVGVYLHRCVETAVAIYGILEAGAVFVPLNPKSPVAYNAGIIADCDIKFLVTHPQQRRTYKKFFASTQVQTIGGRARKGEESSAGSWAEVYATEGSPISLTRRVETDLAYIIYTSGSTGRPKGIMHTHASGLAFARNAIARYGLDETDRFGNHAPISFDVSQLAYFGAPLLAATAVVATDAEVAFPQSLAALLERERISVWYSVPLAVTQLIASEALRERDISALRYLFYAGEAMPLNYLPGLAATFPGVRVANWYGPAETNVCTCYELPPDYATAKQVPIGKVWRNTDRRILSATGQPIADGGQGELCIRSTTQMLGYWKREQRSAKAWYEEAGPGGQTLRFYRTGDLVKVGDDGLLHLLGRVDHQVKVRGYRVELVNIEEALLAHAAVSGACVVAVPGQEEALRIEAVVVLTAPEVTTGKELSGYLRGRLPWYAIPRAVTILRSLPTTTSGKTDRMAVSRLFSTAQL